MRLDRVAGLANTPQHALTMALSALFGLFLLLLLAGVPIAVALGVGGAIAIALANPDTQWWGLMAAPQNAYASIAKYPLLALPMFVLVGTLFERTGVAQRLVQLAIAICGRGHGSLGVVAVGVAMIMGGISGSGPANAAAVGGVMILAMTRAGYPPAYSASVVASAAATDILIPPSIALVVYSVLVPTASVPALFAAGMIPGILAGCALMLTAWWLARRHGLGAGEVHLQRPAFWPALREASWGLAAPVLILGGMRAGWFTPTEAAVVAVVYGVFIGAVIYRTLGRKDIFPILRDSAEVSATILLLMALSGIFAYALNTLSLADPLMRALANSGWHEGWVLAIVLAILLLAGSLLDGVSILMIFLPLLMPLMSLYGWDPVWFGIVIIMVVAVGQITPPMAVNLLVACELAQVSMASTVRWILWFVFSFMVVTGLVALFPTVTLWLPRLLGY